MKLKRLRVRRVAFATVVCLLVSFRSTPSVPSLFEGVPPPPSLQEIALIEELQSWVLGEPSRHRFRAFDVQDLGAAIRARPQSFELFRGYNGKEANRRFLQDLPYGDVIFTTAQRYRLDSLLLAAIVETESSFDPRAVSSQGAVGLMQVLPTTAALYRVGDPMEPAVNVDVGARYFSSLLTRFHGDLEHALAAYNAGPEIVARYGGVPPYRETRGFVDRVLSRYIQHHQTIWESSGANEWLLSRVE